MARFEIIEGPANDGTGRVGWHAIVYRSDGEHDSGWGTFRTRAEARRVGEARVRKLNREYDPYTQLARQMAD